MTHKIWIICLAVVFVLFIRQNVYAEEAVIHSAQKTKLSDLTQKQIISTVKNLDIGMTAYDSGHFATAEPFFKEAINLTMTQTSTYKAVPGKCKWLLNLMTFLGFCYQDEHKYEQSEKVFCKPSISLKTSTV